MHHSKVKASQAKKAGHRVSGNPAKRANARDHGVVTGVPAVHVAGQHTLSYSATYDALVVLAPDGSVTGMLACCASRSIRSLAACDGSNNTGAGLHLEGMWGQHTADLLFDPIVDVLYLTEVDGETVLGTICSARRCLETLVAEAREAGR